MSSGPGWIGPQRSILNFLRVVGADQDEEGRFIIGGEGVYSFLGIDDPANDVVVPADAVYFIKGKSAPLAAGLRSTSSGLGVYVIS